MTCRPATVIDQLEQEWQQLTRRAAADRAVARWAGADPSLRFDTASGLVAHLADTGVPVERHDEVLGALLALAPEEPLAARLLLHRFLPCLKAMARRPVAFDRDEWLNLLVATAYEVIRTYPLDRRPRRIAANIARDIRKRAFAALRERRRLSAELTADPGRDLVADPAPAAAFADVEVADLLDRAVREGLVDRHTAQLLVLTRGVGVPVATAAVGTSVTAATWRQRRRRAERRLATALSGGVA